MGDKRKRTGLILSVGGAFLALASLLLDIIRGKSFGIGPIQLTGLLLGLALFLVGLYITNRSYPFKLFIAIAICFFIAGMALLAINVYGEFVSLRNPSIYTRPFRQANRVRNPKYTPEQTHPLTRIQPGETPREFAYRLNQLIYDSTVHYWVFEDAEEFNHRIPIHENYLLWATGRNYQFCDPEKAIERGVSICSQTTRIIVALWNENGLEGHGVAMDGHVVAEVLVDRTDEQETYWVLDGDYGLVLEYSIATLQEHPEIVKEQYMRGGYPERNADLVADIYGPEGNYIISYLGDCSAEADFYRWKWLLPLALITPLLVIVPVHSISKKARI